MSKHTPGPWRLKTEGSEEDFIMRTVHGVRSTGGDEVAIVTTGSYNDQTEEANARLIAAAPDLLAALKYCLGWMPSAETYEHMGFDRKAAAQVIQAARAAIAKAERGTE